MSLLAGDRPGLEPGDAGKAGDYSESNFDKFSGYSERLFGDAPYDDDDREADRVYAEVDARLSERTSGRRDAKAFSLRKG